MAIVTERTRTEVKEVVYNFLQRNVKQIYRNSLMKQTSSMTLTEIH